MEGNKSETNESDRATTETKDSDGLTSATASRSYEDPLMKQEREYNIYIRSYIGRRGSSDYIEHPNAYQSFPNTRKILNAKDNLQNSAIFKEPSITAFRRQVKSDYLPRRYSGTDTVSDFPINRSRDYLYRRKLHTYMYLHRLRSYLYLSRLYDYLIMIGLPAEYPENELKFKGRQYIRRKLIKTAQSIKDSDYPFYSTGKTPLHPLNVMTHHLTPQEPVGVGKIQVKRYTQSKQNSSKNNESEVKPKAGKDPGRKQTEKQKSQNSIRPRETRNEGFFDSNNHPSSQNRRQKFLAKGSFQHNEIFEEPIAVIDECHLRKRSRFMRDSRRVVEHDFIHGVCEEHPGEQDENVDEKPSHHLQHVEIRTESILNYNVSSIARKSFPVQVSKFQKAPAVINRCQSNGTIRVQDSQRGSEFQESLDELMIESNEPLHKKYRSRITRRIENIWSHICINGKTVTIGFLTICIILLFSDNC